MTNRFIPLLLAMGVTIPLTGCLEANSGSAGSGFDGGSGPFEQSVNPDSGIDDQGNTTGDGSNSQTAFPNDGSVGGQIVQNGEVVVSSGPFEEQTLGFVCTRSLSTFGGVDLEVSAGGLVGSVVGGLLDLLSGDSVNALLNSVNDRVLALDGDLTTAAVVTQTAAGLLGSLNSLDILFSLPEGQQIGLNRFAVATVSFPPSLLDLGLLSSISLDTLLDGEVQESGAQIDASGLSLLGFSTDQIAGGTHALVGYRTSQPYDQVRLSFSSDLLSADLGQNVFVHEICTDGRFVEPPATQ
nr:hypothetical protein [Oceanococcus sp. HetDA_MAG_MS8]